MFALMSQCRVCVMLVLCMPDGHLVLLGCNAGLVAVTAVLQGLLCTDGDGLIRCMHAVQLG